MSTDVARARVFHHASATGEGSRPSFLGSLRPFSGALRPEAFLDLMAAVKALAPELRNDSVDRELVAALWHIVAMGRFWGLREDGLLKRNHLISPEDAFLLDGWLHSIAYALAMLFDGADVHSAFSEFDNLTAEQG